MKVFLLTLQIIGSDEEPAATHEYSFIILYYIILYVLFSSIYWTLRTFKGFYFIFYFSTFCFSLLNEAGGWTLHYLLTHQGREDDGTSHDLTDGKQGLAFNIQYVFFYR